jgi:hypothetical protein
MMPRSSQVRQVVSYLLEAESSVRNSVESVRNQQNAVLNAIEGAQLQTMSQGKVTVINPAFQWAQSLDHVMLSVKFATRMDSPGCLDTFDPNITISDRRFDLQISCRIDKQIFRYELNLGLFDGIDVETSRFEIGSVGRLYANLTKSNKPSRWRRLLEQTEKIPNMQIWWEIHEKWDEKLVEHTQFETDEDFMEGIINVEKPSNKKRKQALKAQKQAAAAAKKQEEESKVSSVA